MTHVRRFPEGKISTCTYKDGKWVFTFESENSAERYPEMRKAIFRGETYVQACRTSLIPDK